MAAAFVIGLDLDQPGAMGLIATPMTALIKISETFLDVSSGLTQCAELTTVFAEL
jgi:hypothetical protein